MILETTIFSFIKTYGFGAVGCIVGIIYKIKNNNLVKKQTKLIRTSDLQKTIENLENIEGFFSSELTETKYTNALNLIKIPYFSELLDRIIYFRPKSYGLCFEQEYKELCDEIYRIRNRIMNSSVFIELPNDHPFYIHGHSLILNSVEREYEEMALNKELPELMRKVGNILNMAKNELNN